MPKKVMTAEELAAYLGFNRSTIYRKARDGQVPAVRLQGVWRFYKDAIDQWLQAKSTEHFKGSLEASPGGVEAVEFSAYPLGFKGEVTAENRYAG